MQNGNDEGGIFCEAHQLVHGRCGDAVYPFLALFSITGEEKYLTAARKVYQWSEDHVSQKDGSWVNEANGKNSWEGISVFSVIALGALRHHGNALTMLENKLWKERLRKGADFILSHFTFETGDINYPISAAAALAVSYSLLGDEKYQKRAKEMADFGLKHFTANNLIWGKGVIGIKDISPKGLRPVDIPYNLDESLPSLALYAILMGDEKVLDIVATSYRAHFNWILPDGGMDAGWCSRQYKWTYYGSSTSDGAAGGLGLMQQYNNRFSEAALRNLKLKQSFTHDGLLNGGADLYSTKVPVCNQHTFTAIKGLATAIDAGIKNTADVVYLPNDKSFGIRTWPEVSVTQIGIGPWRASVTTNDIASSAKRGGHLMGGSLSLLWHKIIGPVAVASPNDYKIYEGVNMQKPVNDFQLSCLTPRIEMIYKGVRYSSVYDGDAILQTVDSATVKVSGNLKDVNGNLLPVRHDFQLQYRFKDKSFQMIVTSNSNANLVFPIVANAIEEIDYTREGLLIINKKTGRILVIASGLNKWKDKDPGRIFNFVPGFEAIPLQIPLNKKGKSMLTLEILNVIK